MLEKVKSPAESDLVVRENPEMVFCSTTVAPGMAAWVGSVTEPAMLPEAPADCAARAGTGPAVRRATSAAAKKMDRWANALRCWMRIEKTSDCLGNPVEPQLVSLGLRRKGSRQAEAGRKWQRRIDAPD